MVTKVHFLPPFWAGKHFRMANMSNHEADELEEQVGFHCFQPAVSPKLGRRQKAEAEY